MTNKDGTLRDSGLRAATERFDWVTVEDAEDGDISEYVGDTGSWAASTTRPYAEQRSLEQSTNNSNVILSFSGLPNYPSQGDKIRFFAYRDTSGSNTQPTEILFYFGMQNTSNYYQYEFGVRGPTPGTMTLSVTDGGSSSSLATHEGSLSPADEWLEVVVRWANDGTITCTVYDLDGVSYGSVSATDTTFAGGGVGWSMNEPGFIDQCEYVAGGA
jgi:hypothetical protein